MRGKAATENGTPWKASSKTAVAGKTERVKKYGAT